MQIADSISMTVESAKTMVVTDYRGLNTAQLNELRQKLAQANAKYVITKNTLLTRALRSKGFKVTNEIFDGPTAVVYGFGDEVMPIKALLQFSKSTQLPKVKGGYLGKDALTAQQVDNLAKLPSKEMLVGQVVGTLNAPIYGLVGTLSANITSLLYALKAIGEKKA